MIRSSNGKFKCAFSISGPAIEQLEQYAPELIDSFKELAKTGSVEFLAEPYAYSLASVFDSDEFERQVKQHSNKIEELFGKKPTAFVNSEMIYSDEIGDKVLKMGYKTILIDEAKHVLGWKSPNYVYSNAFNPKLKLIVRNQKLSDDIAFRFPHLMLTAETFIDNISRMPESEQIVMLGFGYEALGVTQPANTGIFEFLKALPYYAMEQNISFALPSEITKKFESAGALSVPYTISWVGADKNLTPWMGNDLQNEALNKLYAYGERVRMCTDRPLLRDWLLLQSTDNFRYMSHKDPWGSNFENAYDAFMNYMNILGDFLERVDAQYPTTIENEELNVLLKTINNLEIKNNELLEQLSKAKSKKVKKEVVE
jgi:alpha-amylase